MKNIIRRTLIVLWLAAIAGTSAVAIESGLFDSDTWIIAATFLLPAWALQFILTGSVSPLSLLDKRSTSSTETDHTN